MRTQTYVIFYSNQLRGILILIMSSSPQSRPPWRYPRAHLDGTNPIVLRFSNGQHVGANLQVISVAGGLLSLPKSVDQGSRVRLMCLPEGAFVYGGADILPPASDLFHPFRS